MKTILDYLERTCSSYPEKIAITDAHSEDSFHMLTERAKKIGSGLISSIKTIGQPIAVFMDKSVACLETMLGILYSGNCYVVLDTKSPGERLGKILDTLLPAAIISDEKACPICKAIVQEREIPVLLYESLKDNHVNDSELTIVYGKIIDTDPMYILFTSGSTGVPKGVVISHRAAVTYTHWVVNTFNISSETIWGSQTPFYFSMSVTDVFSTLMAGATLHIIPKMLFSFPVTLLEFLNEKKINSVYWVPSALNIVANMDALSALKPETLKKILFAGEVMQTKQLNIWRKALPDAFFANLFGPTETTDICTYYVVDRTFSDTESLPIGRACDNCGIMVVTDEGHLASTGEAGEMYVRGSFLADGYYNNPKQTQAAFILNPFNHAYPETVYKTGDLVAYNQRGELMYLSRKDFQIKHMGYRIELGEIETAINGISGIICAACIYDLEKKQIVLFYQGSPDEQYISREATLRLPAYMCPNRVVKLDKMLYNANGKIDRKTLQQICKGE